MIVAYLVNQYPHVSHSFIRREIVGVEAAGVTVARFAIRPPGADIVDPADRAEVARTRSLLAAGKPALLLAALGMLLTHPVKWFRAFRTAWRLGGAAGKRLRHLIYLVEACLLVRWLRWCGAEHLHTHFGTNPAAVALLARTLGGPPYSFTVHGPEEFDRPDALALREKIAGAAFVVAISSFGRSQLFRWARYEDWGKVRVVRCGVDAAFLDDGPLPPAENNRLVCVGRLAEQKGQLLLVAAAARLADAGHDFELVLAGDGPMRREVEAAVRGHGLGGRVRVTGWLSNAQVRAEMIAARAMVLPSFAEGLPVVIMEALALGRPVVTTFVAGIPELVRDGVNGWLVPAGDVARLADALAAALEATPEELAAMGAAGAEAVRAAHNAATEGRKLAALFTGGGKHSDDAAEPAARLSIAGGA
ncbi:glycosyltransferase [Gemmata sp.]|uniref:glycosyltransferase n=1 Tax=Gemmata sp. TaxID=1914242 RepID=UPI003F71650A